MIALATFESREQMESPATTNRRNRSHAHFVRAVVLVLALVSVASAHAGATAQLVTFAQPTDKVFGAPAFAITATASSGLVVTLSSQTTSACSVSVNTVTPIAAGSCTLRASQAGNSTFAAAPSVDRTFKIGKAPQTISFTAPVTATYGSAPQTIAATSSSKLPVTFLSVTTSMCSVSVGLLTIIGAGDCTVRAQQPGNANYAAAAVVDRTIRIAKANQLITFATVPPRAFGVAPFSIFATSTSKLAVAFASLTPSVCTVSLNLATLHIAGTCTLHATQAGNSNFNVAPVATQSFAVSKAAQSIVFPVPGARSFGDAPSAMAATASSGLPVTFASATLSICRISGVTLSILAPGTCSVRASQAGDGRYVAAADVVRNFAVTKGAQSIAFRAIGDRPIGTGAVALVASATSGLPVALSSMTAATCTIGAGTVSLVATGNCTIRASQAGNADYAAAVAVDRTFAVTRGSQSITFAAIAGRSFGDRPFDVGASSSSGLAVLFTSLSPVACNIEGSTISILAAGTCTIRASQSGDSRFSAAVPADQSFAVAKGPQNISFASLGPHTFADAPFPISVSATSGLAVQVSSATPLVCEVSGFNVTLTGTGDCRIDASQPGNANFGAAPTISRIFAVSRATQTINFDPIGDQSLAGSPVTSHATASSGLIVALASLTPATCSVASTMVVLAATGTCTVRASQGGNAVYPAATPIDRTFSIVANAQTITFPPIADRLLSTIIANAAASASSGLAISYISLDASVCKTDGGATIQLLMPGVCNIRASQSGNSRFAPAASVDRSFNVLATPPKINFAPIGPQTTASSPLSLSATSSSKIPVLFLARPADVCTVHATSLTLIAPGICSVSAYESADGAHPQGSPVTRSFVVLRAPSFAPAGTQPVGPWPATVVAGRFRGGPIVDLAVPWQGNVTLFAGDGKGGFGPVSNVAVGAFPAFGTVADFNNDGKLDFAITYVGAGNVGTYMGAGNDTFDHSLEWPVAPTPSGVVAGDFDGDGNPDLIVTNINSGGLVGQSLTLFTGRGDGTFLPGSEIPQCHNPMHLVAADFNGDGIADLAIACNEDGTVALMLHRANGSVDFILPITGIAEVTRIAASDLDRDGHVDLVTTSRYGNLTVLLGNGDGSFRKTVDIPGIGGGDIVIADLNADGELDIAATNPLANAVSIVTGAGDGTFAVPVSFGTGAYPTGLVAADIDGNGTADLVYVNEQDGTLSVLRNAVATVAAAQAIATSPSTESAPVGGMFPHPLSIRVTTPNGAPVVGVQVHFDLPAGAASAMFSDGARMADITTDAQGFATTPTMRAGPAGGSFVAHARFGALAVTFNLTNQSAGTPPSFDSALPPAGTLGALYTFALIASGSPAPKFALATGQLPPGLALASSGILSGTPIVAGTFQGVISASNGYSPDALRNFAIVIGAPSQSITFNVIGDQNLNAHAVGAIAVASSGLIVVFTSLTPQSCSVGGNTVELHDAGVCTVRAGQPGNAQYSAAPFVDRSFNIMRGSQTVTIGMPRTAQLGLSPLNVDTSASSGLPVTVTSNTPMTCAMVDNAHVNFIGRGSCTLLATQPGSSAYVATQTSASVDVAGAMQFISFPSPHNGALGEPTYLLATASSGLPVTLQSATPGTCRIVSGNIASIGTDPHPTDNRCTIIASQTGNATFDPAPSVTVSFGFGSSDQAHKESPPTPHIVYATYLGGLGSDVPITVLAAPDGGAFAGGSVGTTNFPGLSSQKFSNAGLGLTFVTKIRPQSGDVDYSVALGGAAPAVMTTTSSGEVLVATYSGSADYPQQHGEYIRKGPPAIFKVDSSGQVRTISAALDPAIDTLRAIASDKLGAIYVTGEARRGLVTTPGAAFQTAEVSTSTPFLLKLTSTGASVFTTYLTAPGSRPAGKPDAGGGKHDVTSAPFALAISDAGEAYVVGQSTAADFPNTPGALNTRDSNNRDAFVIKVNASGTAIPIVARIGFNDVDRATDVALLPDGSILVAGKSASVDFSGNDSFQSAVHFSENGQITYLYDREFGFVAKLDATASRIIFLGAIGAFGGDLVDLAYEPAPRPIKIAVDPSGYIYATGTGGADRTLPVMGMLSGVPNEGVFLMKISPNGGQRYSTFLGEGVATGIATDGFGSVFVTGYARGDMPTTNAFQANCSVDSWNRCLTPFVVKVNDSAAPVVLTADVPTSEVGKPITLTARVGDLHAAGTIDLIENGQRIASAPLVFGNAPFTLTPLLGFHHYSATFRGTGYANGLSSTDVLQVVEQVVAP